ncbi:unnamed protein product [Prorocentrum cordatum]|uniref:Uncharacterized protein n=1 Tax=Prorocentrum cordatum TaxID=2364126 RepID=A0ABN9WAY5_9DINO|nr:unnamed protein product [Polarella glacialis]
MLVGMFPEFAEFMVEHEEVLLHLTTSGQPIPEDAPLPPQEQVDLLQRRIRTQREALLQEHGEQLDHLDGCQLAVLSFSWKGLSFFLSFSGVSLEGLLGVEPPVGLGAELAKAGFPDLVETIVEFAHSAGVPRDAAVKLWEIIQQLWNSGFVSSTLKQAVSGMGWWEWARTGITLTATVGAYMASGSLLLIAQMTLTILSTTSLFSAAQAAEASCR